MSNGQIVPANQALAGIRAALDKMKPELAVALPQRQDVNRFVRIALTTLRNTPSILSCSAESILGSIMVAAQLGLECDNVTGMAYLVPFKGKCQLIPGYKGLMALAIRAGPKVRRFEAHVVREGDLFRYRYGSKAELEHIPDQDPESFEDSSITQAYAIAYFDDGTSQFDVMHRTEIELVKRRAPAGNKGPWVTDFPEMAKKTPVRRLCKFLPLDSDKLQLAVARDEMYEAGLEVPTEIEIPLEEPPAPPRKFMAPAAAKEAPKPAQAEEAGEEEWHELEADGERAAIQEEPPADEPPHWTDRRPPPKAEQQKEYAKDLEVSGVGPFEAWASEPMPKSKSTWDEAVENPAAHVTALNKLLRAGLAAQKAGEDVTISHKRAAVALKRIDAGFFR